MSTHLPLLASIHMRLGIAILVLGIFGTIWGALGIKPAHTSPGLRPYLYLLVAAIAVEGLLGLLLATVGGDHPADPLHWFYGPAALLSIPVALFFARNKTARLEAVLVMVGPLAVFLFSVRTLMTGG